MRVTNLDSPRSGRPVANQYEITDDNGVVTFQSYRTPIVRKNGYQYTVSSNWNYSVTTSKYFSQWLATWGWAEDEIKELKKWLRKPRKSGDETNIFNSVQAVYVEEL